MKLLVFLALLVAASAASAEIYSWRDARGTTHYTNSEYEIPARYRSRVKVYDPGIPVKDPAAPSPPPAPTQQAAISVETPKPVLTEAPASPPRMPPIPGARVRSGKRFRQSAEE